jgi:hypothetical protein
MKGPAAPAACCRLGGTRVAAERGRDDDAFSSRLLLGRREEERAPRLALIAFLPFGRSVGLGWVAPFSCAGLPRFLPRTALPTAQQPAPRDRAAVS